MHTYSSPLHPLLDSPSFPGFLLLLIETSKLHMLISTCYTYSFLDSKACILLCVPHLFYLLLSIIWLSSKIVLHQCYVNPSSWEILCSITQRPLKKLKVTFTGDQRHIKLKTIHLKYVYLIISFSHTYKSFVVTFYLQYWYRSVMTS